MWTESQIRAAIEAEREIARHPIRAQVTNTLSWSRGVRVDLEPLRDQYNRPIDETLEGARAWWSGSPPVTADIYAVDPDEPALFLTRLNGAGPKVGDTISIYELDYYKPLSELWAEQLSAGLALRSLTATAETVEAPTTTLDLRYLRTSQRKALGLARHSTTLLWGPPGTGKTTTLGALVADEIVGRRSNRVLVTATTHTAVDQAIVAVDSVLERTKQANTRRRVKRFGSGVDPKFFIGREHLLPAEDTAAFQRLTNLLESEPRKSDLETWSGWKQEVDALRARLKASVRDVLERNACVGMTITSAFFWFQAIRESKLDLVVVDEASQLGGPSARMIATAATRILFAGDPKQLSAVVRTKEIRTQKIMSETAFDIAREAPQVFLEEQSRMAPPICSVVSKVFYEGKLVVAKEKRADKAWLQERSPYWIDGLKQPQFQIRETTASSNWSQKYKGPIRYDSAQEILALVDNMLGAYVDPTDIVILTPFRAQRGMLRVMLAARRSKGVHVSTVHRAQGSERRIVIFDPVDGSSKFLTGPDGDRLINVAISRAQAQVVVFLSKSDRQNRTLERIAVLARGEMDIGARNDTIRSTPEIPCLKDFAGRGDFPACLMGQYMRVGKTVGEVVGLEKGGDVIVVASRETGQRHKFKTKIALRMM